MCDLYHVDVSSPEEQYMSDDDETKELVKLPSAPVMDPGAWVGHWDADNTEADLFVLLFKNYLNKILTWDSFHSP